MGRIVAPRVLEWWAMLQVTSTFAIPEHELIERFVRSSGPGGQNVNKVATAVELRYNVLTGVLPEDVRLRLVALAGKRISGDGVILVDSRAYRTQGRNRAAARARLVSLLREAFRRPRPRAKTAPTRASREKRLAAKERRGRVKAQRRYVGGDES